MAGSKLNRYSEKEPARFTVPNHPEGIGPVQDKYLDHHWPSWRCPLAGQVRFDLRGVQTILLFTHSDIIGPAVNHTEKLQKELVITRNDCVPSRPRSMGCRPAIHPENASGSHGFCDTVGQIQPILQQKKPAGRAINLAPARVVYSILCLSN